MFSSNFISSVSQAFESVQDSLRENRKVLAEMPDTERFLWEKSRYFVAVLDTQKGRADKEYIKFVWSSISARAQCSIHNAGLLVSFLESTPSGNGCYSKE